MSARWFRVCRRDELKDGRARSITILGKPYAVFSINGEIFGLDAACRHMRANLAAGKVQGHIVTCFMHAWQYDVRSGKCLTTEAADTLPCEIKIENGDIYISVEWPSDF